MRIACVILIFPVFGAAVGCAGDSPDPAAVGTQLQDDKTVREWAARGSVAREVPSTSAPGRGIAPVENLIGRLESRLAASPDDVEGWSLLAASHAYTGSLEKAAVARNRAVELGADSAALDAQVVAAYSSGHH